MKVTWEVRDTLHSLANVGAYFDVSGPLGVHLVQGSGSEFLDPLSSFSVGYKSQSYDANDSKKEDLSQLFCI